VQLGYNTNGLQNHRLEDALQLLADRDYQVVALTPDTCHLDPFRSTALAIDATAALLAKLQLGVVMETGARFLLDPGHKHAPTLMTRDPAARQRRLDFTARVAELGRRLGAKVVSFWTGIDHHPGADSWSWMREGVAATVERIRATGLQPSLEPEPGMALETVAQWRRLQRELGAAAPALTLDIGHLYAVWEGEPVDVIADSAPFLAQVHLEDMRRGQHEHLLPGTGDVDFDSVLTALHRNGYRGPVCFELSRSSHCAPDAVATCRDVFVRHRDGLCR
jgi:sugar phosphate isomerase/epimerase